MHMERYGRRDRSSLRVQELMYNTVRGVYSGVCGEGGQHMPRWSYAGQPATIKETT